MAETTLSGVRIDYSDQGSGEPALLLLPAWCMSRAGFDTLGEKLAVNRRVLSLDWRGSGRSEDPTSDFGAAELVEDALAVIEASGAQQVIPVTISHAGWVGIELRRRLGDRVPKLIHTDWVVLPPPPPYMDLVKALATPEGWQGARDTLFSIWLEGVDNTRLIDFVRKEMGGVSAEMWMRSGREIGGGYAKEGYPLKALASLSPPAPTLHIYAQPKDPGYLGAQEAFGVENAWYSVHQLAANSHFPTFEVADEIAAAIEAFVRK